MNCSSKNDALDGGYQPQKRWYQTLIFLLAAGIVIHIACILILASVPPISRDALIHHLTIPKMYLIHGGFYEIPFMHFSYFPMNIDLLYMLPLYLGFDIGAKYIHFFFALLTAGLIYRYLHEHLDRIYASVGALLFLSIPIIVKLSVTAYVDLGLIFFSWASLYCLIKWHDSGFAIRYLVFSGIACGLALGTKYNGLIPLLIMSTMLPLIYSRETNRSLPANDHRRRYRNALKGVSYGVVFILVSLTVFSPWMIRNVIWKQNPVYPLFNNVFNRPEKKAAETLVQQDQEEKLPRNAFWMRRYVYQESFAQALFIPIRAFFQGEDNNPKYFDGKLNPLLLLLSFLAFIPTKWNHDRRLKLHRRLFLIYVMLFPLFVLFRVDYRIRYMAPALPAMVVLSVFGLRNTFEIIGHSLGGNQNKSGAAVVALLFVITLGINGKYVYDQFKFICPFDYLNRSVDRDAYLSRYLTEYPVIAQANRILPKAATVLCLSIGDRTYYLNRAVVLAEDFYNKDNGGYTESLLIKRLRRFGTTHIIIDTNIFFGWAHSLNMQDRIVFQNVFQNNTDLLYEKNGVRLLKLRQS